MSFTDTLPRGNQDIKRFINKSKKAKTFSIKIDTVANPKKVQGDLEISLGAHVILSEVITMHVYYAQDC